MLYNLDKAFEKVGEYGRTQWLLTFVTCIARNAGTYLYYTFAYLVFEQQFLCWDNPGDMSQDLAYSCSAE